MGVYLTLGVSKASYQNRPRSIQLLYPIRLSISLIVLCVMSGLVIMFFSHVDMPGCVEFAQIRWLIALNVVNLLWEEPRSIDPDP